MMMTNGINTTNAEWRECKFAEFGVHLVSVKTYREAEPFCDSGSPSGTSFKTRSVAGGVLI